MLRQYPPMQPSCIIFAEEARIEFSPRTKMLFQHFVHLQHPNELPPCVRVGLLLELLGELCAPFVCHLFCLLIALCFKQNETLFIPCAEPLKLPLPRL